MIKSKTSTGRAKRPKKAAPAKQGAVRRSVSLNREVDALAHELVGDSNFSAFVNEAVRQKTQQLQMLRLLEDLDDQFGPIDEAERKKAEALMRLVPPDAA